MTRTQCKKLSEHEVLLLIEFIKLLNIEYKSFNNKGFWSQTWKYSQNLIDLKHTLNYHVGNY